MNRIFLILHTIFEVIVINSLWENTVDAPHFKRLIGDIKTDVLVIGGGMAGLLCAHFLKNQGVDCVVVEANKICGGVTHDTTAKITYQHGLIYHKIIKSYGAYAARLYLNANKEALAGYKSLCKKIKCDFEISNSFVYSINDSKKIERELDALLKIGCACEHLNELDIPVKIAGAIRINEQAQFNPLKFAYELAKDLKIYENTTVTEINGTTVKTGCGQIHAQKIIVATHFPFINRYGAYFLKMYQHRSYVIALKNTDFKGGMYVDDNSCGLSFRSYGDTLLLGGGGHRTGKQGGGWIELEYFARKHYKNCNVVGKWATQDCITLDSIPYIGKYSKQTPNLYVATGFNKWGMTSSYVAAQILCDMVLGRKNKYEKVFAPSRSMLHPQLFLNIGESALGLVTPTVPRCTHMGCALKYNPQEHSWDCVCHGSRYTHSGKLINNPATHGKSLD